MSFIRQGLKRAAELRLSRKKGNNRPHMVYCLPIHNYVGVTTNFERRMREHRYNGKDIAGAYELTTVQTKLEAYQIERIFHELLCEGSSYKIYK